MKTFAPRRPPADDDSQLHAGGEIPRFEQPHDDPEVAARASDTGDGRRQALDWIADQLRWNRTLKELRANRAATATPTSSTARSSAQDSPTVAASRDW